MVWAWPARRVTIPSSHTNCWSQARGGRRRRRSLFPWLTFYHHGARTHVHEEGELKTRLQARAESAVVVTIVNWGAYAVPVAVLCSSEPSGANSRRRLARLGRALPGGTAQPRRSCRPRVPATPGDECDCDGPDDGCGHGLGAEARSVLEGACTQTRPDRAIRPRPRECKTPTMAQSSRRSRGHFRTNCVLTPQRRGSWLPR